MYKFSIITVCLNSAKTISSTIESLIKQTYQNFEYIIVDGKSRDETIEIISRYTCTLGDRFQFISEKDKGLYDAMNKGIEKASGDIIGILNSDDWYEIDTLEKVAKVFEECVDIDIVTGELRLVTSNEKNIEIWKNKDIEKTITKKIPVHHPATFVKKRVYDQIGKFDLKYKLSADYDFICRAYINQKHFIQIDEILVNMRVGGITGGMKQGGPSGLKNAFISTREDYLLVKENFKKDLKLRYYVKIILLRLRQLKRCFIKSKRI